jgi:hypothetical protein
VIVCVSHHNGAIRGTTYTKWRNKFTIGLTPLTTPNHVEWLAFFIREDLHAVIVMLTHQEVIGGGLDAEASRRVELALLLALTSHRGQMVQVWSVEILDPVIVTIRDDNRLVLAIKCDAPRSVELTSRIVCPPITKHQFFIHFPLSEFLILVLISIVIILLIIQKTNNLVMNINKWLLNPTCITHSLFSLSSSNASGLVLWTKIGTLNG